MLAWIQSSGRYENEIEMDEPATDTSHRNTWVLYLCLSNWVSIPIGILASVGIRDPLETTIDFSRKFHDVPTCHTDKACIQP